MGLNCMFMGLWLVVQETIQRSKPLAEGRATALAAAGDACAYNL